MLDVRPGFICLRASGAQAWDAFKHESGPIRFQRVPPNDRKGRVQSSTITVTVLREPQRNELVLRSQDLKVETMRGSGSGGQHKNVTESAVRITHIPTGVQAYADSRSQHINKDLAMGVLRARLLSRQSDAASQEANSQRRQSHQGGNRGEKIRTVSEQNGHVVNHLNGKRMDFKRYQRGFIEELY